MDTHTHMDTHTYTAVFRSIAEMCYCLKKWDFWSVFLVFDETDGPGSWRHIFTDRTELARTSVSTFYSDCKKGKWSMQDCKKKKKKLKAVGHYNDQCSHSSSRDAFDTGVTTHICWNLPNFASCLHGAGTGRFLISQTQTWLLLKVSRLQFLNSFLQSQEQALKG